jgi:NAD(P)-dependent dehydrogenase (short-subunit alcohol dehydrogenase family)
MAWFDWFRGPRRRRHRRVERHRPRRPHSRSPPRCARRARRPSPPELEAVAAQAGEALVVPTDVTDRAAVRACFDRVVERFGRVDIVVNNAGVLKPALVLDLDGRDLEAMLRVNLFGALYVMQEAVRRMLAQEDGVVVNVASLGGRRGVSPIGGYCATKFALVGLTEALREELHGKPVHVALGRAGRRRDADGRERDPGRGVPRLLADGLNMPPSWVVWAIFAAARFRLTELSVPPGAGTFEKLAALAPGVSDALVHWTKNAAQWLARRQARS